ncbi:MAG: HAD family phosphatase, partial [Candidatus Levyibacteriota bacterium]
MSTKAVIFDKDGVLMLTEPLYHRAYQGALDHFGAIGLYDWDTHRKRNGMPATETYFFLRKKYKVKASLPDFLAEFRKRYKKFMMSEELEVPEGVRELLSALKKADIKVAIATSGHRESTAMTLEKTRLSEEFGTIITSDDVAKGKPDPEIFLLAAERLGVSPKECLVIGDSINDVLGAKSAGMKVIAITD